MDYLINGITLNRDRIAAYVNNSLMLVTALTPKIGYDKAAKLPTQHTQMVLVCAKLRLKLDLLERRLTRSCAQSNDLPIEGVVADCITTTLFGPFYGRRSSGAAWVSILPDSTCVVLTRVS